LPCLPRCVEGFQHVSNRFDMFRDLGNSGGRRGRGLVAPAGVARVLRWLLGVAAVGSGVLCVVTAALVAWSYAAKPRQQVGRATPAPAKYREVALGGGYLAVSVIETFAPPAGLGSGYPYGAELSEWNVAGLRWRREAITIQRPSDRAVVAVVTRTSTFVVWLGWPLLLSALVPAAWLIWRRKVAREGRKGMCRVCGYDLRASPDRCPECGTSTTMSSV
jgi:hypothetical protein